MARRSARITSTSSRSSTQRPRPKSIDSRGRPDSARSGKGRGKPRGKPKD